MNLLLLDFPNVQTHQPQVLQFQGVKCGWQSDLGARMWEAFINIWPWTSSVCNIVLVFALELHRVQHL